MSFSASLFEYRVRCWLHEEIPDAPPEAGTWPNAVKRRRVEAVFLEGLAVSDPVLGRALRAYQRADLAHRGNLTDDDVEEAEAALEEAREAFEAALDTLARAIPRRDAA